MKIIFFNCEVYFMITIKEKIVCAKFDLDKVLFAVISGKLNWS